MQRLTPRKFLPAAVIVSAVALGGCNGMTYGTGVSPGKQTVEDIAGLASLSGKKSAPIDYEPRPPIVAPPSTATLPKPGETTGTAAAANWPKDPDEAARARKLAQGKGVDDPTKDPLYDPGFRLPAHDTGEARTIDHGEDQAQRALREHNEYGKKTTKIFADAKAAAAVQYDADGKPVRKTLSEPPSDYRVPDATAPESFDSTEKKATRKWWWPFGS